MMTVALSCAAAIALSAQDYHPKANPEAVVVVGNARFTVLTSRLIRMEWAEKGAFEDRPTLAIVNRDMPVPTFKTTRIGNHLTLKTSDVTLVYNGPGNFNSRNLSVTFTMTEGGRERKVTWHPGMSDAGNLLGTTRTLDGCDGIKTIEPYDPGVVSRDGWAIIDESSRHVMDKVDSNWKYWVAERDDKVRQDLYIFAYGHDYMAAVSDFTRIAGRIPLPPKYAFGYWWCRYWLYSDHELVDLAQHFRDFNIPVDVMIIDMDWHETWDLANGSDVPDASGHTKGWTGYTWKKELFPNPAHLLEELHRYGVKTSLNLHPASGVQPFEEPYERFVSDYLARTTDYDGPRGYVGADGEPAHVPFRIDQMAWADAYFNSVLRPMEQQGVDFWWLDWQQERESGYVKGLSNTFWLNHTFFQDQVRRSASLGKHAARPMIYHRWGGLGSHRYQVGFSGDTRATWQVLSYLPYFTSTAANVGYGYWGHDIGGHNPPKDPNFKYTDPEIYTRWLQSGVFTPIFKTHSTKDLAMEKRFWVFPEHFDYMREAIRLRYTLSPYIYGAARQAYDSGISICRPMYYYHPEDERAYSWKEQFMFGDNILATTVCKPVDAATGLAEREMWFPEGNDWYDVSTGKMYKGGQTAKLHYTIAENPYFVRAGAIIPMASQEIASLQQPSDEIVFFVAPGGGDSSTVLYEDDGRTQAYASEFAVTEVSKFVHDDSVVMLVAPRRGFYRGILAQRKVRVTLEGSYAPQKVRINGVEIPYDRFARQEAAAGRAVWGYDGNSMAVTVYAAPADASEQMIIEMQFEPGRDQELIYGKKGLAGRVRNLVPETKSAYSKHISNHSQLSPNMLLFQQFGSFVTEDPANADKYLRQLDVKALEAEMKSFGKLPEDFVEKVVSQCSDLR